MFPLGSEKPTEYAFRHKMKKMTMQRRKTERKNKKKLYVTITQS